MLKALKNPSLLVLATHAFNLIDLRPGRAGKALVLAVQDEAASHPLVLGLFSAILPGTRFDVTSAEPRRVSGIRNFRQALASPYPVFHFTIRRGSFVERAGRS